MTMNNKGNFLSFFRCLKKDFHFGVTANDVHM